MPSGMMKNIGQRQLLRHPKSTNLLLNLTRILIEMVDLFLKLSERIKENRPSILITITRTRGSTPGKTGFKILIGEEGRIAGTIGGGAVEFLSLIHI